MNNSTLINLRKKLAEHPNYKVLVVFKGRHPFLTDLDGLDLSCCASILIMNSFYAKSTSKELLSRFNFVCWFDGGDYWKGDALARLDLLSFPEVEEIINVLVQSVSPDRIRLVAMEESFVRFAAILREKCKIPGPKTVDTEPFTSKVRMKILARTQKIPVPKFQIVSPAGLLKSEENLKSLEEFVGYPMILKPAHGVGGAGVYKLFYREELLEWLEIRSNGSGSAVYLAEEYVEAEEYNLYALVQKRDVQFFPTILVVRKSTVLGSLRTGSPLATSSATENPELNSRALEFGGQILDALNPYPNSVVMIQMFLTNQESEFKFSKVAYRVPDAMNCVALQQNSGISPETVHIMAQIKRLRLADYEKPRRHFGAVVYPWKKGVVLSIPPLPEKELDSDSELFNYVKQGQQLDKACNVGDVASKIYLWNSDHSRLVADIHYLCDNYAPVIS